ncbi:MAG: radical SAM family heme chaperone HemW [Candidatus Firestonebacteria bacterium]
MKEIGIYIHIPFCIKKCNYCDFNSYVIENESLKSKYIKALMLELDNYEKENILIKSIYIGGGTPTVLSGCELESILKNILKNFKTKTNIEITVEANPGTIDYEKILILKNAGVNRLSFGLQSTDDKILKCLGRIHTYSNFLENYNLARKIKFNNINIDIMFGIPGQTVSDLKNTLLKVKDLQPEHISAYDLTVEEGTNFYNDLKEGRLKCVLESDEVEMYYLIIDLLKDKYLHYEISNFAMLGKECIHNKIYWTNDEYIGIGAGACSKFNEYRYGNEKDFNEYIKLIYNKNSAILYREFINKDTEIKETTFLGLRLLEGINVKEWSERFGMDFFELFKDKLARLEDVNLIEMVKNYVRLTRKGLFLSNEVFVEFI